MAGIGKNHEAVIIFHSKQCMLLSILGSDLTTTRLKGQPKTKVWLQQNVACLLFWKAQQSQKNKEVSSLPILTVFFTSRKAGQHVLQVEVEVEVEVEECFSFLLLINSKKS